ncbi:TetR family transcriptional regulator [Rhodobacteraceae bacterium RKSG542]|uniref:TetR family transcriptional regulator C-terminal domain-containing protein n=1 Tax=Pseudovibrio flavus TaxID=2529854 RepID=UPI0012BBA211|nr:TetR family transcriptional regulator C-terminal domain-containing protein [Pseudovibrio flavus]MTI16116.1 TetR family transcriptional regulator [Pseudovibrio flavus]
MGSEKETRREARIAAERAILQAAEEVFAIYGFKGSTMARIAQTAGLPKANIHYYFPTKLELYRRVVEEIYSSWLEAGDVFDNSPDAATALSAYIESKMDTSRLHPFGSKVWANEILQGAPVIQDYLETSLRDWTQSRIDIINRWIAEGQIAPVDPRHLLYMIWAVTQHYADFSHQVETLNGGKPLRSQQWHEATQSVKRIILNGISAQSSAQRAEEQA